MINAPHFSKIFIRKIAIGLLLSIIIISCCRKREYIFFLSDEDVKWNPYKQGQYILFKINQQDTDTIVVSDVARFLPPDERINQCADISDETISVSFDNNIKYYDNISYGSMRITATYDGSPAPAKIIWGSSECRRAINYLPAEPPSTSMVINGITYNNVYEINQENALLDSCSIAKYYFNKEYGFLKYVLKNGKYYELIK